MKFYSTRNPAHRVDFRTAVLNGLAPDGGLYMPEQFPQLPADFIETLPRLPLTTIGCRVLSHFADGIAREDLDALVRQAVNFDAPLIKLVEDTFILELFHGPTLAFKDFGARMLARLMNYYHQAADRQLVILVATSGDTGSAVASAFLGMDGIRVGLLYPSGQVSTIQEQQLTTMGGNVTTFEVSGSFDDCQRLVKQAFTDETLKGKFILSSANSINLARLLPQSFYYFHAVGQLKKLGVDGPAVFTVPSGNFGNLTAGLMAQRMGLPVEKFIAAVNANRVFSDYLQDGHYLPRASLRTLSNAMDVGAPSNFERMAGLFPEGHTAMRKQIDSFSVSDEQTLETIRRVYKESGYLIDPHGAVGLRAWQELRKSGSCSGPAVILETAHPAKFADIVGPVIGQAVPLPQRLGTCLTKEKEAIDISADYPAFRAALLELS